MKEIQETPTKDTMNVFSKLQLARVLLQDKKLQKSGQNKYSNYWYYELKDFLPEINSIFNDLKLCSNFSYHEDQSILDIYNSENTEEFIRFSTINPDSFGDASKMKGSLPIQVLGALQTYQRRYLYLMALEIVEVDAVEQIREAMDKETSKQVPAYTPPQRPAPQSVSGDTPKPVVNTNPNTPTGNGLISDAQVRRIFALSKQNDVSNDKVKEIISHYGYNATKEIKYKDYESICKEITG